MKRIHMISIIIGMVIVGTLAFVGSIYLGAKSSCESFGGKLIDYNTCQIDQPQPSNICDPGPVLDDGYCYKNGMKIILSDFLEDNYVKKSGNEKEMFVRISLEKFPPAQKVNYPLGNFTIILEGYYPTYNAPDIKLEDDAGNIIWTNYDDIGHVYSSRTSPTEFCKVYYFNDIGGPLVINKTGTYKMIFSFEEFSIEQQLGVLQSTSSISLDKPDFQCP